MQKKSHYHANAMRIHPINLIADKAKSTPISVESLSVKLMSTDIATAACDLVQ